MRRTDDDGRVAFRLGARPSAGVYGVAFQVVGDGSVAQSQLWVVSPQTEVVAMQLDGAVFDDLDDPEPVDGAVDISGSHGAEGQLVAYVHGGDGEKLEDLERWRRHLRDHGFAIGPVVDLSAAPGDTNQLDGDGDEAHRWGESNNGPGVTPPLQSPVATLYSADPEAEQRLAETGLEAVNGYCRDEDDATEDDDRLPGWRATTGDGDDEDPSSDDDPG